MRRLESGTTLDSDSATGTNRDVLQTGKREAVKISITRASRRGRNSEQAADELGLSRDVVFR